MIQPTKRAVSYIRMSTDDQDQSPDRQRAQIVAYAQRQGYSMVREYSDLGLKGWDVNRPGYQGLLGDAQSGLFDVIVVDELSRLSRIDTVDFFALVVRPLRAVGVQLDTVADGPIRWDDVASKVLLLIRQDRASEESPTLARRCATQNVRLALQGKLINGKAPYGYRHVEDRGVPVGRRLGPEDEVRAVRMMFEWYADGDRSLRDIVRELQARGVPSPAGKAHWSSEGVRGLLLNPAYCGDYAYNRTSRAKFAAYLKGQISPPVGKRRYRHNAESDWIVVPDIFPAIVSRDLFQRVKARLEGNRGRTTPLPDRGGFALTKLLVCGHCGGWMTGGRNRGVARFRCFTHGKYEGVCDNGLTIREDDALRAVFGTLSSTILSPARLDELVAEAEARDRAAGRPEAVEGLRAELGRLDGLIRQGEEKLVYLPHEMCGPLVESLKGWRDSRLRVLGEIELVENRRQAEDAKRAIKQMRERMWLAGQALESGDVGLVRSFLRDLLTRIELWGERADNGRQVRYRLSRGLLYTADDDLLTLLLGFSGEKRDGNLTGRTFRPCQVALTVRAIELDIIAHP